MPTRSARSVTLSRKLVLDIFHSGWENSHFGASNWQENAGFSTFCLSPASGEKNCKSQMDCVNWSFQHVSNFLSDSHFGGFIGLKLMESLKLFCCQKNALYSRINYDDLRISQLLAKTWIDGLQSAPPTGEEWAKLGRNGFNCISFKFGFRKQSNCSLTMAMFIEFNQLMASFSAGKLTSSQVVLPLLKCAKNIRRCSHCVHESWLIMLDEHGPRSSLRGACGGGQAKQLDEGRECRISLTRWQKTRRPANMVIIIPAIEASIQRLELAIHRIIRNKLIAGRRRAALILLRTDSGNLFLGLSHAVCECP